MPGSLLHSLTDRRPLILTLLLAGGFYWLVYNPFLQSGGVDLNYAIADFLVVESELESPVLSDDPSFVAAKGPYRWQGCSEPCYNAVRMHFEAGEPLEDYGILPAYQTDNFRISVNGYQVAAPGRLTPTPSYHGQRSFLSRIPKDALIAGQNQVDIVLARHVQAPVFTGAFIGPYDEVLQATKTRSFWLYDFKLINSTIGLVLGGLSLILVLLVQNRQLFFWFSGIAIAWGLLGYYRHWDNFPFEYWARVFYYYFLLNFMYLAAFNFYDLWSGENRAWQRRLASGFFVTILGLYWLLQPWFDVLELEAWLSDAFQITISGWLTLKALQHYFLKGDERIVEAAAMLVCISSLTVDVWAQYLGFNNYYTFPRTLIVFIVAILASIIHRNIRLYETQQVLNDLLEEKVQEQQVSLEASYQKMRDMDRARTLSEERRRLLSDMHDGIGGQLVSLLSGLKSGKLDQKQISEALEQSLQDLRLLIDSMDEVSDDLVVALGTFRSRIEPLLQRTGIKLDWQLRALPFGTQSQPRDVLHVFRILQEAITNVIKHANATQVRLTDVLDEESYTINIIDDGDGVLGEGNGYGVRSMQARAENLGGELTLGSTAEGTVLALRIPAPQTIG